MSDRDAFREAGELKMPDEWCTELGYEVLDPDGWRGTGGRPWTDPISRAEFEQRLVVCTQRRVPVDERAEFRERRDHGLKARHETREARAVRKHRDQFFLMSLNRPEVLARFQRDIGPATADGCQLWQGRVAEDGYGLFSVGLGNNTNARTPAHRVALLLAEGLPKFPTLQAAHSCRNKHCVAAAHLRWATAEENAADRKRDGTQQRTVGRMHGMAKLTPDQVRAIRFEYALGGVSQRELGKRFGIAQSAVSNIVNKRRWGFLDEPDVVAAEQAYAAAREIGSRDPQ